MKALEMTSTKEQISQLEQVLHTLPQAEIKIIHHFSKGLYAREIFIPKGTLLVGKIHKHECLSIMSSGEKTVLTDDGYVRVKAPFTTVSKPGMKRVGYAHEDTVWTTIHATDETDLEKLEIELIAKSYDDIQLSAAEILDLKERLCLS